MPFLSIYSMEIGDLVTWKEDPNVVLPWFYKNWKDMGIVVDFADANTVIVQWCSGDKFPVWIRDMCILSKNNLISKNS